MLVTNIGTISMPLTGGGGVGVGVKVVSTISVGSGVGDSCRVGVRDPVGVSDPVGLIIGVTEPDGVAVVANTCSPLLMIVKRLDIFIVWPRSFLVFKIKVYAPGRKVV